MKNRWNPQEASQFNSPLEQRVYSSRLLGQDLALVMHGGGNTSVKDTAKNLYGESESVIYIKGSGWDLATIEARGFPGVRMEPLNRLRSLKELSDEAMMNALRGLMMDSKSPDPSVETLLHAFLPHRFVDHTHADAVLTLTNQPNGEELIRKLYGNRIAIVPYVMPGFLLAKLCAEVFEKTPQVEGLVLLKHGIFSFGETAKQSYDRMIDLVQLAEEYVSTKRKNPANTPAVPSSKVEWANEIRKEFLCRGFKSVLKPVDGPLVSTFVNHPRIESICNVGPVTPDHVIRTKRLPLFLRTTDLGKISAQFDEYAKEYEHYFVRNTESKQAKRTMLDTLPRVVVVQGVGIYVAGATEKDAAIAHDIYRHTVQVILDAEDVGKYSALDEADIFDVEYWILEQNKLKIGPKRAPLSGKIAVVTGGASGIGHAIASELKTQGAVVHVLDLATPKIPSPLHHCVDVGNRGQMSQTFQQIIETSGGVDILVINAGIFPKSDLLENIASTDWDKSLNVNLSGALHTVSEGIRWMKKQGQGGDILFIASKNVPAPGKEAASYSVAKAGQTQLMRIAALEGAKYGIRVNALHPHLVLDTALWGGGVLESRAKAYKMSVDEYKKNNLLGVEITSKDVAQAAFSLVSGAFSKTTGLQLPFDGGSDRTI